MICSNTPRLIEQRFLAKVCEAGSGCWLWVGAHTGKGFGSSYGMMRIDGELYAAHYIAWLLYRGPLPEDPDICVLHTCDTPPCVNPEHLFLGTHLDNMRDAVRKGRISRTHQADFSGVDHANAKLTEARVLAIRGAEKVVFQKDLAKQYGVSQQTISRVLRRKRYRNVRRTA